VLHEQYIFDDLKHPPGLAVSYRTLMLLLFAICTIPQLSVNGQKSAKPILVNEFNLGLGSCDDLLSRLDSFYADLHTNPGSKGFVALANTPEKRRQSLLHQLWIERYTRYRGFDPSRIEIVRVTSDHDPTFRFWRLPEGVSEPSLDVDDSFEIPPTIKKPFLFGSYEWLGMVECTHYSEEIFARFLIANPKARANIVVRAKSPRVARRQANKVVSNLVRTFGIARSRISVFIRNLEHNLPLDEAETELWYLP